MENKTSYIRRAFSSLRATSLRLALNAKEPRSTTETIVHVECRYRVNASIIEPFERTEGEGTEQRDRRI